MVSYDPVKVCLESVSSFCIYARERMQNYWECYWEYPRVSHNARDSRVQQIIDERFRIHIRDAKRTKGGFLSGGTEIYYFTGRTDYELLPHGSNQTVFKTVEQISAGKERFDVLDIGTGNGLFLDALKRKFQKRVSVLGISATDFREEVQDLERRLPDREYILGNAEDLHLMPFSIDRKFDLIVSCYLVQHLHDPLGMLCQSYELLKPGGILIVSGNEFDLKGIFMDQFTDALKAKGYDFEVISAEFGIAQLKIKKTAPHLDLFFFYDLSRCTRNGESSLWDPNSKYEIHYTTESKPRSCSLVRSMRTIFSRCVEHLSYKRSDLAPFF